MNLKYFGYVPFLVVIIVWFVSLGILDLLYAWLQMQNHRFQQNMETYRNLITQSMYDKQLDSGRGTLLHLCDDVIQQEVGLHV